MLLKSTYEECIFHTLMQRDQWFRILIGSKRSELGRPPAGDEDPDAEDPDASELEGFSETSESGMLTKRSLTRLCWISGRHRFWSILTAAPHPPIQNAKILKTPHNRFDRSSVGLPRSRL